MARIQRILCPVDFFPASLQAADYAIGLARNCNAKLHLLHVICPVLYNDEDYPLRLSDLIESLEKESGWQMNKLREKARAAGVTVAAATRTGDVKNEILSAIRKMKADVLVMGTHGRRGLEKWLLGSVAEGMLRRSPVPVLTFHGTRKPGKGVPALGRILVTTDFSEGTADALNYALPLARANRSHVILMHVLEEMRALTSEHYRDELAKRLDVHLQKLIPADARKWCDIETRIESGTAYYAILKVLKKEKIDLLVMSTHGKGMLDRAILGSTSERVVRAAKCPVLLVPPRRKTRSNRQRQKRVA
jgi:nucleotide-binding universal stress UspA family protein